ncbi:MAG: BamA/TamA family outer membrane protein, partial [Cyanobacteria bacterium P01_H01_bin.15]
MHYRLGFLGTLLLAVLGWTTAVIAEPTSGSRPLTLTVVEDNFFDFQLQKSAKNADNAAVEVTQGPEDPKTESEPEAAKDSTGIFAPTADNLVIGSGQSGQPGVIFGFGSLIAEPTTLNGLTRTTGPVPAQNQVLTLSPVELYTGFNFSEKNRLLLEIQADPQAASGDLSYTFSPESIAGAFSLNVFTQRAFAGVFVGGNRDVELSDNRTPWLHRTGAGFEYTQAVNDSLDIAAGANYQRVTVRDGAFSQNIFAEDEFGNAVTVSKDGKDDLVTLSFAGVLSNLDNRGFPTRGNRVRFGTDVSLPITNTDIFFSRVSGGIVQYVPVDLFGFGSGERTLVFSAQGG